MELYTDHDHNWNLDWRSGVIAGYSESLIGPIGPPEKCTISRSKSIRRCSVR